LLSGIHGGKSCEIDAVQKMIVFPCVQRIDPPGISVKLR